MWNKRDLMSIEMTWFIHSLIGSLILMDPWPGKLRIALQVMVTIEVASILLLCLKRSPQTAWSSSNICKTNQDRLWYTHQCWNFSEQPDHSQRLVYVQTLSSCQCLRKCNLWWANLVSNWIDGSVLLVFFFASVLVQFCWYSLGMYGRARFNFRLSTRMLTHPWLVSLSPF